MYKLMYFYNIITISFSKIVLITHRKLWRFMVGENHQKTKKTQVVFGFCAAFQNKNKTKKRKEKKTSFEAKPKNIFKVFFVFFLVLRFCGYCHSLHITSFQIYQENKQGLYYLCVCVLYIYMYVCLEGHDTRGFEVGTTYVCIYIYYK